MKIKLFFLFLLFVLQSAQAACESERVSLQVLGSGGPELDDQRASSSYLIWLDGKAVVLVDTGTGSAVNFEKSGAKFEDVQAILYTHLHVDHSQDLPAYIKASFFTPRNQPLTIYGPNSNKVMPSTVEFVNRLFNSVGVYPYLNGYVSKGSKRAYKVNTTNVDLEKDKIYTYKISDAIVLRATAVHHGPIAAIAWRVEIEGCSITFSGDMSNRYNVLAGLAKGSDILLAHNAIPEGAQGVARNLHMPPSEIGKIANAAKPKTLILSHRMKRTMGKESETEVQIRSHFSGEIVFADDMDVFDL